MQVLADGTFHRFSISFRGVFEKYGIYIFLGLLFVTASLVSPQFLNPQNLKDILNQAAALGMVAIGQTFVILIGGGGLDLSVASVMATVAVIVAHNTQGQDALFFPIIIQGLRFLYTGGAPKGGFPPILRFLGTGNIGPVPTSIFSLAILAVVTVIVLKKTTLGRQIYVIGGNIETAYLSGYRIDLIITVVYVISGFTAAIAGLYLAGYIGVSDNWVGKGYELDSIAAVVMGGTSFAGGRGGVMGTIVGVLILIMLYNLVLLLHLPVQVQFLVKGSIIILATSFYAMFRRSSK